MRQEWVGKRKSTRQGCQIKAELRFLEDRAPVECTIVNISRTGSRIDVNDAEDLPDLVDVFIPSTNELKYGRIVRRELPFIGVEFMASRSEDPRVFDDLMKRLAQVEQSTQAAKRPRQPRKSDETEPVLEQRIAALEAELAAVRQLAQDAAERPMPEPQPVAAPAPDRLPEIQALHVALVSLADRLEKAAAVPPAVTPDQFEALAADVESLRLITTDLGASVQSLAAASPAPIIEPERSDVSREEVKALSQELTDLRQSLQTLILLVSQLIRRNTATG